MKRNPDTLAAASRTVSKPKDDLAIINTHARATQATARNELHQFLDHALVELRRAEHINTHRHFQWHADELPHHTFIYMHRFTGTQMVDAEPSRVMRKAACLYPPGTCLELVSDADHDAELYILEFDLFRVTEKTEAKRIYERELQSPVAGWIQGPFTAFNEFPPNLPNSHNPIMK